MKKFLPSYPKLLALCSLPLVTICLAQMARAQENHLTPAPPPMKFISSNERSQLSAARDTKARIRTTLEMAETRLLHAEEMTGTQRFDEAASDLGCYQGLMEDALHFLSDLGNSGKLRDLYKRVELSLRAHAPRLEAMRRSTPAEYAVNIKAIMDFARDARTEALNAFYGNTVLHEDNAVEATGGRTAPATPPRTAASQEPNNQP